MLHFPQLSCKHAVTLHYSFLCQQWIHEKKCCYSVIVCLICSIFYMIVLLICEHNPQCFLIVTLFRISAELSIFLKKVFRLVFGFRLFLQVEGGRVSPLNLVWLQETPPSAFRMGRIELHPGHPSTFLKHSDKCPTSYHAWTVTHFGSPVCFLVLLSHGSIWKKLP